MVDGYDGDDVVSISKKRGKNRGMKTALEGKELGITTVTFIDPRPTEVSQTEEEICVKCLNVLDCRSKDGELLPKPGIYDLYCRKFRIEDSPSVDDIALGYTPVLGEECQVVYRDDGKVVFRSSSPVTANYETCDKIIEEMVNCGMYEQDPMAS